jgi:hypothetical protein
MDQIAAMDWRPDPLFLKALCLLIVLCGGIWLVCFLLRKANVMNAFGAAGKITRTLDTCSLDQGRKLVVFTCPFGQGVVLISPKGDQMLLFNDKSNAAGTSCASEHTP